MLTSLVESFLVLVAEGKTYLVLLPVYVLLLTGERVAHGLITRRPWNERDGAANIAITIVYLGVDLLVGHIVPVALMAWLFEHARLLTLGTTGFGWLVAFLLHDLTWYVDHRLAHRVAFMWAPHHVHHSSPEYNTTVASRGFVLDNVIARPMFYLLPVLGVSPFQFIVLRIGVSIFGICQHTRLVPRLGWLDWLFATPSNHRVHHGSDALYLDRNYGEVLMIWDHLFGTYQREEQEPTFGVTDPIHTTNPITIECAGFRWLWKRVVSAPTWKQKLRALVMPPEWNPTATERDYSLQLPVSQRR